MVSFWYSFGVFFGVFSLFFGVFWCIFFVFWCLLVSLEMFWEVDGVLFSDYFGLLESLELLEAEPASVYLNSLT